MVAKRRHRQDELIEMGLFIGVMSGTSMDAVDTVLVDLSTSSPQLVASLRSPWDSALRNRMRSYAAGNHWTPLPAQDSTRTSVSSSPQQSRRSFLKHAPARGKFSHRLSRTDGGARAGQDSACDPAAG